MNLEQTNKTDTPIQEKESNPAKIKNLTVKLNKITKCPPDIKMSPNSKLICKNQKHIPTNRLTPPRRSNRKTTSNLVKEKERERPVKTKHLTVNLNKMMECPPNLTMSPNSNLTSMRQKTNLTKSLTAPRRSNRKTTCSQKLENSPAKNLIVPRRSNRKITSSQKYKENEWTK